MENKILDFQFEHVCAKQTRPNYSVGSDQDKAEIQYDRWSTHRSSHQRRSMKKVFLEIPQDSQESTCARVSFLIKVALY